MHMNSQEDDWQLQSDVVPTGDGTESDNDAHGGDDGTQPEHKQRRLIRSRACILDKLPFAEDMGTVFGQYNLYPNILELLFLLEGPLCPSPDGWSIEAKKTFGADYRDTFTMVSTDGSSKKVFTFVLMRRGGTLSSRVQIESITPDLQLMKLFFSFMFGEG